jgi:hypothetical protein
VGLYVFMLVPRTEKGQPLFDSASILEVKNHDCAPIDRLKEHCATNLSSLIYLAKVEEYAIGSTEIKVIRTKVGE